MVKFITKSIKFILIAQYCLVKFSDPRYANEDKRQVLKLVLQKMIRPWNREEYFACSLEAQMDTRLQGYEESCDPAHDSGSGVDELFKKYNQFDVPNPGREWWDQTVDGRDTTRTKIQRTIMKYPSGTICNHFKLLTCTPALTCYCKNNFT